MIIGMSHEHECVTHCDLNSRLIYFYVRPNSSHSRANQKCRRFIHPFICFLSVWRSSCNSGRRWCWMCRRRRSRWKKPQANRNNNTNTYHAYFFPIVDNNSIFMIDDESSTVEMCTLVSLVRPMRIEFSFFENGLVLSNCVFVICSKRNENEISTHDARLNSDQWRWALIGNRRHSKYRKEKEGKWMSSAAARL